MTLNMSLMSLLEDTMQNHKFYIEVLFRDEGSSMTYTRTNQQFETVVACRSPDEGRRMVEAQYGGPDRCRVTWRGPAQ